MKAYKLTDCDGKGGTAAETYRDVYEKAAALLAEKGEQE